MVDQLRPVCAPQVSEPMRRRLLDGADSSMALLAAVLTALFGAGAVAVLASSGRPEGAPHTFDELVGGGGLLVAGAAGLTVVHGVFCALRRRWAQRTGVFLSRHLLADLAVRDPQAAALLALAQRDIDRIRAASARDDEPALRRAEWAVSRAALDCGGDAAHRTALSDQVDQLSRWADRQEESRDRLDQPPRSEPAPGRGTQCGPLRRVRVR
ncbi:hypothetical protein [Actinocatenispora comari]|uniref:Uncharacterized protein n=1 Tax=Actinocatenispora comari TaxID=2807577 RepID=A0A8J4EM53_9ACTN|nr:hypothetical protein [Actinocatenispora comari]GIL30007.1 hypothetical protein NUM_52610 [Actinocatenispora comari]